MIFVIGKILPNIKIAKKKRVITDPLRRSTNFNRQNIAELLNKKIMELQNKKIEYKYGAKELHEEMTKFLNDVKLLIEEKNYHLTDNSKEALEEYDSILWNTYLQNVSKNKRKNLNKYLSDYNKKRNRYKANLLLHFIHTKVLTKTYIEKQLIGIDLIK